MLPLQDCDVQQWAEVTISVFGTDDSPSEPGRTSSCFLPTETGTGFFLDSADLRGGTAELPIIPLQTSWLGSLDDFLSLATCSADLRESVQHSNFWHDVELKLSDRLRVSFRQTSFFGNPLQAWAQGIRTLSCSHKLLDVASVLGNKVILHGRGEYLPCLVAPVAHPSSTRITYIGDRRNRHAGRCFWRFLFRRKLGALRRAPHISTPDNSTCIVWRKPLAADGGLAFRLSDGKRVTTPVRKDMTLARNSAHTYHFE